MPRISPEARRALVEERKLQILKAAARVFSQKGFERATIADVAQEARLAEGSIYNYYKNKNDLLASVPRLIVVPAVQPLLADLAGPLPPPEPVLRALAQNMVRMIRENIDVMRIVLSALPSMGPGPRRHFLEQTPLYAVGLLETFIGAQIEAGVFRRDLNPAIVARIFPGMLIAFLLIQEVIGTEKVQTFDYDVIIEHVVCIFLQGVLAEPSAPQRIARKSTGIGKRKTP
jgi:TetR/AcrR family fatty acid metabolism transcriptional regulator